MEGWNGFHCVQLSPGDRLSEQQLRDIALLIYDTDPYIYPALFGGDAAGRSNAARILPAVIEAGTDKMFCRENLFLLLRDGEVCGLILWHRGPLRWSPDTVLACAEEQGVRLDRDNVQKVSREYVDSCYQGEDADAADTLSLINVCVKQSMRGEGAGKRMLRAFLHAHPDAPMELVVLSDNIAALTLYQKVGFGISGESDGFSLSAQKPRCTAMLRAASDAPPPPPQA